MDKNPLIGVSTITVIILVLASLTNVVGYQAVQSSNPYPIVEYVQKESAQSSKSRCGCENENTIQWSFPGLCTFLSPLMWFALILYVTRINLNLITIIDNIGNTLNCFWSDMIP
ncbi:Uncharacterised protein [uncultured archaeon]|nr:Uncharacterised protein [uncultured archaeon]